MRKNLSVIAGALASAVLVGGLAGCQKAATGQVAAVVNGEEISQQELNAELATVKLPDGADKTAVRNQALQRIVDRRILAQQAKTGGIDRDPEYLMRQRQLNEALLIQLYAKKTQDTLRIPDTAAVDRYIAANPQMFANRTMFYVDQISFPTPQDPSFLPSLNEVHSLDGVAAALKAKGIEYNSAEAKIDSAQVPPDMLARVQALPPGEPFIVPTPQGVVASVIKRSENVALPAAQARPMAVQAMRNQELGKLLEKRLKDAKATAKVEYQPGFGPAPTTGAPKTPAGTTKS